MANPTASGRLYNLDLLRGFIVLLAFIQHYTGYLNQWYLRYFRESSQLSRLYEPHADFVGRILPSDSVTQLLGWAFIPWVTQFYLFLAAFNLGNRSPDKLRADYPAKMQLFAVLFCAFTIESMLIAQNFGQAVSIYPLQTWMICLAVLAACGRYFGWQGVAVLFAISWLRFALPLTEWNDGFNAVMKTRVHAGFSYDAPPDRFITSGALGFLAGYAFFSVANKERLLMGAALLGSVLLGIYVIWGAPYVINPNNIYAAEHTVSEYPVGLIGIVGIQLLVVSVTLWLERRGVVTRSRLILWLGANSLLAFFLHKMLFLYVIMPLREFVGAVAAVPVRNNIYEILLFAAISTSIAYATARSGFFHMLGKSYRD